jgi:hypothetical protein
MNDAASWNDAVSLKETLHTIAGQLRATPPGSGDMKSGGSRHRGLSDGLQTAFIAARKQLFQRGIFDPLLVRFDTATVSQASNAELADQLEKVAAFL